MPTLPYLHFQGQCAAALTHYCSVLGGSDLQLMHYAEGQGAPAAWQGNPRIMHGQVTLGDGTLMASDYPPGMEGQPQSGFSVMHSPPDLASARRAFDRLAEGGAVIEPFQETFFSPGFGMLKDKFGTHWIISAIPGT